MLKPVDLLVTFRLVGVVRDSWSYEQIAGELYLAVSQTHRSVQRLKSAGLMDRASERVVARALRDFVVHGARYVFPATVGRIARGVPTASASPAFATEFGGPSSDPGQNLVWPSAAGEVRGLSLQPLTDAVPDIALHNPEMYARLAAFDAIRAGRARERALALTIVESFVEQAVDA